MPAQKSNASLTAEQQRAALAFEQVSEIGEKWKKGDDKRAKYGALASKLPTLLRAAGLCQAVHFIKSRSKPKAADDAAMALLNHLGSQLRRIDPGISEITPGISLCTRARSADLESYLWLSREAIAAANWFARLAKSELEHDPTKDVDGR